MAALWPNKKAKKCQNRKIFFLKHFLMLESIYLLNFRKFYQTVWNLPIFLIFGKFWLFFGCFMAKKGQNQKIVIFVKFSFVGKHLHTKFWEASTYQISEFFYQMVWILPIFFIFCQFWLFFTKKYQKMTKSKNNIFVEFSFVGKYLHTKFQKILSNGFYFANFFNF